ncbi:MAG: flagellar biosynthesis protein FlhF [Phycisphaerae bacterium]|nr:flagellar biosynthesis protein FlhF [Phycisphaerae bacterium]
MSDALAKVKTELGRDAVILHTRTVKRGGIFGVGARSLVEITATADSRLAALRAVAGNGVGRRAPSERTARRPVAIDCGQVGPAPQLKCEEESCHSDGSCHPGARSPREDEVPGAPDGSPALPCRKDGVRIAKDGGRVGVAVHSDPVLRTEVTEIRAMVKDLLYRAEQSRCPRVPAELVDYYTQLLGQDVGEELATQLLGRVACRLQERGAAYWDERGRPVGGKAVSPEWIREELQRHVVEMLPPADPLTLRATDGPTVVAMVGPTGVGKTTTIAKLAANMKLREGKKVGLMTIDTYRIAAVEQLKTYAEILQVPLVAVKTPDEMREAMRQMSDVDLVLIDTAGRSQKDELKIADLRRFLTAVKPDQVHLVLSSTSREEAIREAIRNFSVLGAEHVIFTKLDEAVGFGVILNVLRSVDMRLSYVTNGQSVPADIEAGSARRVAQLVLGMGPESAPSTEGASAWEGGR